MTHHSKLVRPRPSPITHHRVAAPETSPARASTSLALSMMVALRYLDGRVPRTAPAPSVALADPIAP